MDDIILLSQVSKQKSKKNDIYLIYIVTYTNFITLYRYVPLYTIYFNFICQKKQNVYREEQIQTETIQ